MYVILMETKFMFLEHGLNNSLFQGIPDILMLKDILCYLIAKFINKIIHLIKSM